MKQIPLTQGKFAIVDDKDFKWLNQYKWCAMKQRYGEFVAVRRSLKNEGKRRVILMHRQIMNTPKDMQTDHQNHNGLDDRRYNLRVCTHSQNQQNKHSHENNSSKYKGVYWFKRCKKWRAQISPNGKKIHLGYFNNEIEAAKVYDQAATKYFGEFAYLNFTIAREKCSRK